MLALRAQVCCALLADRLIVSGRWSATAIRKGIHLVGSVLSAALLLGMVHAPSPTLAVALLTLSNVAFGSLSSGAWVTPMTLCARYAGLLEGVVNGAGNIAGIVAPLVTGVLLDAGDCPRDDGDSKAQPVSPPCHRSWLLVFYLAASFFITGLAAFLVFGSSEPLDMPDDDEAAASTSSSHAPDACAEPDSSTCCSRRGRGSSGGAKTVPAAT